MQAAELSALLHMSAALTASLDLAVVLQTAVDSAVRVLGLETGAIYMLEGDTLLLGATTPPLPPDFPEEYTRARLQDHPHIQRAMDSAQPVSVVDSAAADLTAEERSVVEARGIVSLLYIPLVVDARPVGVFILGTTTAVRAFEARDVTLSLMLARQVTLAVLNARLYDSVIAANAEVRETNENLERLVAERTSDLEAANEELQSQTDALQAQAADLEELASGLADANEAKTRFLRSMSHELRTPLNSVIGFSDFLLRGWTGDLTAEQSEQIRMIHNAGRHLLAIIDDLLDLSRIEAGAVRLTLERIDVPGIIDEIVRSVAPAAEEKSLALVCTLPEVAPTLVSDPVRLRQILLNLLGNAVKYTDSGTVTVKVEQPTELLVSFVVSDTGPGIASEHHDAVFGEFVQIPAEGNLLHEGTGLGLAISRRLATALGGALTLQSRPGEGATFTLTLPVNADSRVP
jgi:signal transduction histidine kinase